MNHIKKLQLSCKKSYKVLSDYLKWAGDWKSTVYTVPKNAINNDTIKKYDQIISSYKNAIENSKKSLKELDKSINDMPRIGGYIVNRHVDNLCNDVVSSLERISTTTKKLIMSIQRELNKVSMSVNKK